MKWIANEGVRISAIFRRLQDERFTNPDAGAVLTRLEASIGIRSGNPSLSISQAEGAEADRTPLDIASWTPPAGIGRFGYDANFLSTSLPLKRIVRRRLPEAARLKNSDEYTLDYMHFSSIMHRKRRFPMLTAVNINGALLKNPGDRSGGWRRDIRLDDCFQSDGDFYRKIPNGDPVQFSRGHLVRRVDPCWGTDDEVKLAEEHSFHYTNAAPQVQHYNDVDWGNLEDYLLDRAQTTEKKMTVFTGPVFRDTDPGYGKGRGQEWQIPVSFWKVAVIQKDDEDIAVAAFMIGQLDYLRPLYEKRVFSRLTPYSDAEIVSQKIQTTLDVIEAVTKFDFERLKEKDTFAGLPESTARDFQFITRGSDIII
jgi:endonuclease G